MSVITQKQGTVEYLTAEGISAAHCFTTRLGGVSKGIFDSMNIAIKAGETEENVRRNMDILAAALGFAAAVTPAVKSASMDPQTAITQGEVN